MTTPSAHRNGEGERARGNGAAPETYGPITLVRHLKDDGRTLILYTLRPPAKT